MNKKEYDHNNKSSMKQFKTSRLGFKNRVFRDMKRHLILSILIPFVGLIVEISWVAFGLGCLAAILIITASFVASFYSNRYYLHELIIDPSNQQVRFRIKKYDNIDIEKSLNFSNFDLEVNQRVLVNNYQLIIKEGGNSIFKQNEAGDWDRFCFEEILKYVRELQDRPAYTDYIR